MSWQPTWETATSFGPLAGTAGLGCRALGKRRRFYLVDAVWSGVAARRWWLKRYPTEESAT
jgi:hypothetical protein